MGRKVLITVIGAVVAALVGLAIRQLVDRLNDEDDA